MSVDRTTVDLSAYPDLVMILLGMRVNTAAGVKTLLGFGPQIAKVAQDSPDGLLSHETFLWSLFPPHAGIRQYWRDFAALEFLVTLGAPSRVVEGVSPQFRRHRLLARDLLHARRCGSRLR